MREIKFRVWNKSEKKMFSWEHLIGAKDIGVFIWIKSQIKNNGLFNELMQYTGLDDKNGKEIYEGDIVRINNYKIDYEIYELPYDKKLFKVIHNRYTYAFENYYSYIPLGDYNTLDGTPWELEIIGNIYENPELLQEMRET